VTKHGLEDQLWYQ